MAAARQRAPCRAKPFHSDDMPLAGSPLKRAALRLGPPASSLSEGHSGLLLRQPVAGKSQEKLQQPQALIAALGEAGWAGRNAPGLVGGWGRKRANLFKAAARGCSSGQSGLSTGEVTGRLQCSLVPYHVFAEPGIARVECQRRLSMAHRLFMTS